MFTEELLDRYRKMTDSEKIAELRKIIRYGDLSPLEHLFATMLVVEPDHIEEILKRLKRDHHNNG